VRLDRQQHGRGTGREVPSAPLAFEEQHSAEQQQRADLTRLQRERAGERRQRDGPPDPPALARAAEEEPEPVAAEADGREVHREPQELRLAGREEAERQHDRERPRRVPHHHGLVRVPAVVSLERKEQVGVVGVLAREGEFRGGPVLDEVVRRPDGRVGEQLANLPDEHDAHDNERKGSQNATKAHART
jgi:hypothetical protein